MSWAGRLVSPSPAPVAPSVKPHAEAEEPRCPAWGRAGRLYPAAGTGQKRTLPGTPPLQHQPTQKPLCCVGGCLPCHRQMPPWLRRRSARHRLPLACSTLAAPRLGGHSRSVSRGRWWELGGELGGRLAHDHSAPLPAGVTRTCSDRRCCSSSCLSSSCSSALAIDSGSIATPMLSCVVRIRMSSARRSCRAHACMSWAERAKL